MVKKKFTKKMNNCIKVVAMLGALSMVLGGCGSSVVEENKKTVIVERNGYQSKYTLNTVKRADVVLNKTIRAQYREMYSEDISFADEGRRVAALYVKKGDEVKKGQLLAELEGADQSEEIEALEYHIARNKALLSHTEIDEVYEISKRWWNYIYKSGGSKEQVETDVASIQQKYEYLREDYQDAIELANMKLAGLQEKMTTGHLYAGMDGRVTFIKSDLLGSISRMEDRVITIMDNSACLFEASEIEYADCFREGEVVSMQMGLGKNAKVVDVLPYHIDGWDEKLYFELVQNETTPEVKANDIGVITLELQRKEQVLALPDSVIHTADGQTYVYVLGENDIREVRWIETGLYGDRLVEIVSGLTEGESVVLK